ncbi:HD domain-containing phosphohydrolase [Hydrogenophaga sp. RWCD_12]|uniref:HD domain-containing phosphohydrolase n=1 Tax=Hydrogenophaga sp. RWCD_12 TaxID=3391190 RepID=UPI003984D3E1
MDDEPSILNALRRLLRLHGITTLQASSGKEALELLKTHEVDLVISDMRMPEMDGARLLEQIKEHDPSIIRMLLTGYADMQSTIAAINQGAIHRYLAKPWDDQELVLSVKDALARRELERENARLTQLTKEQNQQLKDANAQLESRVAARTAELSQINDMLEASYQELDDTLLAAFRVLSSLIDLRHRESGHSRRVAELSRAVAKHMGLSERDVRDVYLAALVHDIGKIGYPDAMLTKPVSAFTPDEVQRHQRHTLDGETALMSLQHLGSVSRIVRQHHERVDGKGFPDGLSGSSICIGARIVAAATDLDQLLHGSLGDQHHSAESASHLLKGGADTRYDRQVLDSLIKVWTEMESAAKEDVQIDVRDLRVGMVLARDLVSSTNAVLLATGYVFDEKIVRQVTGYAARQGVQMFLWIRSDSIDA